MKNTGHGGAGTRQDPHSRQDRLYVGQVQERGHLLLVGGPHGAQCRRYLQHQAEKIKRLYHMQGAYGQGRASLRRRDYTHYRRGRKLFY